MKGRKRKFSPSGVTLSRSAAERSVADCLRRQGLKVHLRSIDLDGYKINYASTGRGRPLLLIHGANIGWGQWMPNMEALAREFQVIAVDLPGCGGSSPVDFDDLSFSDYTDLMTKFVRVLKLETLSVIGHSFGAAIAIRLAGQADLEVDRLVLVGPLGFTRRIPGRQKLITLRPFAKLLSKTVVKPSRLNIEKFLADSVTQRDAISPELVDYFWAAITENRKNHPILFMHSLTRPLLLKRELLLTKEFIHLKQPALIIIGDKDRLMPSEAIKRAVADRRGAHLKIFPDTGHVPSLEYPEEFNQAVLNFLQ
jgi:pimeloyl-ACP methyl ester carboxylesterase